ncbi:glycoside hydrolase family 3 N-terminal domain-containing protein [Fundicoccus sp. Sow4_D5]|uniref:glycoside hydrolase family 3 N-terminal domain-containing protein n=1 Tax=unclassified Fundicoccus TaxID=2761543 RepID=UPI003F8E343B
MKKSQLTDILGRLTLEEKVGQLVQLGPMFFSEGGEVTGPMQAMDMTKTELYQIGSILGTHTKEEVINIQETYLANATHGIPLMFMADVIHGYETIFPIPLALASSFDPKLVKRMASLSAEEATAAGVNVTFSPMADLVRDARWGRVLESNGEDPLLSSLLTKAYVEGYQGDSLLDPKTLAACVKHFIGYGEAEGGRDYNTVDMSDLVLYQNHLPAFKAAIEAGVKLVMTSFNTIRGVPASGNKWLLQDVLRRDLGFEGLIISDWASIHELINHRVAADKKDAAYKAANAGVEIDMMTDNYQHHLVDLVKEGLISQDFIDSAVRHVLELKNDLGLFEDPYRSVKNMTSDSVRDLQASLRQASREIASQSMVLLENKDNLLPLKPADKLALIGPLAESNDLLGAWSWIGKPQDSITIATGLQAQSKQVEIIKERHEYVKLKYVDKVIVALGEHSEETGEGGSKTHISLPQDQLDLLKEVYKWNQNIVLVLINGRPLDLTQVQQYSSSILEAWFPGSEAGHAIADVLFGHVNPSGKLPMSFPRSVGQLPISYNMLSTGRKINEHNHTQKYVSKYLDNENTPLYPFGYGLNYSDIRISEVTLQVDDQAVTVNYTLTNHSQMAGQEVVQLYIKDVFTEIARPERELKAFEKVVLAAGESKQLSLTISDKDIAYYHSDLSESADSGAIELYLGLDSDAPLIGVWDYKG